MFTISFDSWTTDRKIVTTGLEYQGNIGSASNNLSPTHQIRTHETAVSNGVASKANNIATFHNLNVRHFLAEIHGVKYPRDSDNIDCNTNENIDQYRDLKLGYKEYVGEGLLNAL